jgi:hypothetical protein
LTICKKISIQSSISAIQLWPLRGKGYNQKWMTYRFESVMNISKMNKGKITKPFQ